jgi:hypothetical protein
MVVKLGEALARPAELQTRLAQVRDRLRVTALVQEGDQPAEDPQPLLAELDAIASELETLSVPASTNSPASAGSWTSRSRTRTGRWIWRHTARRDSR